MLIRATSILCRRTLLRVNTISQGVTTCRHIHILNTAKPIVRNNTLLDLHKNCRIIGISSIRHASTNETPPVANLYNEIPDPPTPVQEVLENIVKVHANGEPTFQSLGLGGFSPVGLIQQFLEFLHIGLDIPWWTTICLTTIVVRTLIFPLVIISQKNMIKFSNHMPKVKELQATMTEARQHGDHYESARAATELMKYMKTNDIKFGKNFLVPIVQAPIFISFFLALRGMANLPVESLKHGGFLWLQDLTMHDPYYIMPLLTSVTMYFTIELGADGTNIKTMGIMRYALRILPFALLPIMINFPGTILTYWASTNFISLVQTGILKIPRVRKFLNMPTMVQHLPQVTSKKPFKEELKESWTNMKITKQLAERERADAIQFQRASRSPIIKTFKYDPTKQKPTTILTKNR